MAPDALMKRKRQVIANRGKHIRRAEMAIRPLFPTYADSPLR